MTRTPSPAEAKAAAQAAADTDDWKPCQPLTAKPAVPPLPVDVFPGWAADMIKAVAESTQTPSDLPGVVLLGGLATAAGGRAIVVVDPDWIEPLNLYATVAMEPGSRKSPVFREMIKPVRDAEQELQAKAGDDISERQIAKRLAEDAAERALSEAAKKGTDEARVDAIAKGSLAASIAVPSWPRLIADDATPEALISLMAEQDGRIAVLSAEGDVFDYMIGNRYSKNGRANLGVFLKGHAGDELLIDRKGRAPERIDHPALTITVCIQHQVLLNIASSPDLRGRGGVARILYSVPPDIVGHRKIDTEPVSSENRDAYRNSVCTLILSLAGWTDPARLQVTLEARKVLRDYQAEIEPRLRKGSGDYAAMRDWAAKLAGAAVRFAGLLHLAANLRDGWGTAINDATMRDAVRLADYFAEHAKAAFALMGSDPVAAEARALLAWIERAEKTEFSKKEIHDAVRGQKRFEQSDRLDRPLALLVQHRYLRPLEAPGPKPGGGRPPSPRYRVHPGIGDPDTWSAEPTEPTEPTSGPDRPAAIGNSASIAGFADEVATTPTAETAGSGSAGFAGFAEATGSDRQPPGAPAQSSAPVVRGATQRSPFAGTQEGAA